MTGLLLPDRAVNATLLGSYRLTFVRSQVGSRLLSAAPLAQSAERLHGKEKVYGSIP